MKYIRSLLIILFIQTFSFNLFAQAPHAIPYQAVARNASGNLIPSQLISLRFTLHDSISTGTVIYQEKQSITTNALGLFSVNIGQGIPTTGVFSAINWKSNSKFLQVELDTAGGTNFITMGTTQLLSVPYALFAKSNGDVANNGLNKMNDSIGLGGRLNKATTISLDGNEMVITDMNTTNITNLVSQPLFSSFVNIGSVPLTQTFLASTTVKLAQIRMYVSAINGTSISLNLKNSIGATLGSFTNTYIGGLPQWSTFIFNNSPLLNAGEVYTISVTGTAGTVWYYSSANPYSGGISSMGAGSDFAIEVKQYGENGLLYLGNNNIGIGTDTPDGKLDVNGKTKTTQLQVTNNAGVNKILVSDASGNAIWTASNTIASGTLNQAYNFGNAGAGRTILAGSGAVRIDGTDGLLVTGIFGNGDDVEVSGAGTRMFFNPKKGAFRAGQAAGSEWNHDSIGINSFAVGYSTKATGAYSVAMGSNTSANNSSSTSLGSYTEANGVNSTALGKNSQANGNYSTAIGLNSYANQTGSTAIGTNNEANGAYSVAMGEQTIANGYYSTTMGKYTQSNGYAGLVIGTYNDTLVGLQAAPTSTTPLFIIGNGVYQNGSNAFLVRYDGKVSIGTNSPTHLLHVNGIARSTQSAWATSSDKRVKKNIQSLENNSLQKIMQLRPVTYEWIDEYAKASKGLKKHNTGFISQELEQVFPEMVEQVAETYGKNTIDDFRLLNLSDLQIHLVKAMQEQQKQIDDLKKEILDLKELIMNKAEDK